MLLYLSYFDTILIPQNIWSLYWIGLILLVIFCHLGLRKMDPKMINVQSEMQTKFGKNNSLVVSAIKWCYQSILFAIMIEWYAQTNRFLYLFISDRDKITLNHQVNLIIQAIRLKTLRHYLIFEGQLCLKKDHHRGQGVQLLMHLQSTKRYGWLLIKMLFG